jgi:hypothetical protein
VRDFMAKNGVTKLPGFGQSGFRELHEQREKDIAIMTPKEKAQAWRTGRLFR